MHLVLASASPRRAELLRAAGLDFEIVAVEVDESVRPGEPPETYVRRLAMEKSARGSSRTSDADAVVIGADTAVVVDGRVLGKPEDERAAAEMLRALSGRRHRVMTGISLRRNETEVGGVETTVVAFAPLAEADLVWYAASGEGRDKAGAYAIQGLASRFVTGIEGSYTNVVGLPVHAVFAALRELT